MIRTILATFLIFMACISQAAPVKPLSADNAFSFSSHQDSKGHVLLEWKIAPEYFLYRDKIKITTASSSQVKIEKFDLPPGKARHDEIHGLYQIYINNLQVPLTLNSHQGKLQLEVSYQGCSKQGFCYPPIKKTAEINLTGGPALSSTDQSYAASLFEGKNFLFIIFSFLGLGLLLAFTPCVLPMVPILSGIIVGQGKNISTRKAFLLSLAYVFGMAVTYAAAGMVVASLGSSVQAAMQAPWVIVAFSGLFVLLALSMFGLYEFRLPSRWQQGVTSMSNNLKGGTYAGVFLMGALSTLIVSPCVSAPLVGVLGFIGQTGDLFLGGSALLALGFGMGLPLLVIGASAGKLLPKAGLWMEFIKELFGFLMLAMAVWMLSRVASETVTTFLWSALCIFASVYLVFFSQMRQSWKAMTRVFGIAAMIYGAVLMGGLVKGHPVMAANKSDFVIVKDDAQLQQQLLKAKQQSKIVLLDFYADWCTSCVLLDKHVFSEAHIKKALTNVIVLRADVTANDKLDQALLKKFGVIAPPTILFFNPNGKELSEKRIVGEVNAEKFLAHLNKIKDARAN